MTYHYAVVGHPVAHSKSPLIHAEFAHQTGQDLTYTRLLAPLDGFAEVVAAFRAGGGAGLNVTVPFKEQAFEIATCKTARAQAGGAVNTLKFEADEILGDNTDGAGLAQDLTRNLGVPDRRKKGLADGSRWCSPGRDRPPAAGTSRPHWCWSTARRKRPNNSPSNSTCA